MIKRDFYLNQIIERMWNGNIKVITGIRRGGKSTLLFGLFKEYLLSTGVSEDNIIEIELDKRKYYKFRNPIYLCDYVESIIKEKKRINIIFLLMRFNLQKKSKIKKAR